LFLTFSSSSFPFFFILLLLIAGSWVAGAASNGPGSYLQKEDDISEQYLEAVITGVEHLYGKKMGVAWLDGLMLNKGLVDYH